jgi:hypothetical protein
MFAPLPRQRLQPRAAARNAAARLRRLAALLASACALLASACALLALAAASPAMAMTVSRPHYGQPVPVPPAQVPAPIHTVTAAGMPGWQIMLIAGGAAALAALLAVTADRARAARRHMTAPSL